MTPTERTLRYYRDADWSVHRVERWVQAGPRGGFRKDFLGFIDFLALRQGQPVMGIQSCGTDFAGHRRKIEEHRLLLDLWLSTGSSFELIGWRRLKSGYEPRILAYPPVSKSGES